MTYRMTYKHRTAFGTWLTRDIETDDPCEYRRWVDVVHEHRDEYEIICVERFESEVL